MCWFLLYNNMNQWYVCIYPLSWVLSLPPNPTSHPSRSSQSNELSSLCYTAGSVYLFVLLVSSMLFSFSSAQSPSRVWLFATRWTVACQSCLPITNSRSLLKLMSVESVMPSNHLILCCPLLLPPSVCIHMPLFAQGVFLEPRRLCSACTHSKQKLLGNQHTWKWPSSEAGWQLV